MVMVWDPSQCAAQYLAVCDHQRNSRRRGRLHADGRLRVREEDRGDGKGAKQTGGWVRLNDNDQKKDVQR
jgi:hypothetical protein